MTLLFKEAVMASLARQLVTNYQVSVHLPAARRRAVGGGFSGLRSLFKRWRQRMRQRAELARFDERSLRDIGQSDADVQRELAKWVWQE
jgi:uncharacterized protein YjiS (DUF1127 family)